jgi:hypothetical protein
VNFVPISCTGLLLAEAFEAALLVVGFLSASGVPHEPEAVLWRRQGDWETGRRGDGEMERKPRVSRSPSEAAFPVCLPPTGRLVAGAEVVGAVEDASGKAGFHTVHVNSCLGISSSW